MPLGQRLDGVLLPTQLGRLSTVSHRSFQGTGLTGSVPSQLGSMSNLAFCNLHSSSFTGALPTELGLP